MKTVQEATSTESIYSKVDNTMIYKVKYINQIIAAVVLNIGTLAFGCAMAYTSPAFFDMDQPNSTIKLDSQEQSFFGSLLYLGALFGGLIAGPLADMLGRKITVIATCLPFIIGWGLIFVSSHLACGQVYSLYVGRAMTGLSSGAICLCCPVYISELSSSKIRGALGAGFAIFANTGIFLTYLAGTYLSWNYLTIFCAIFPVILAVCIIPIPESPVWLVRQRRTTEAKRALYWFRGAQANIEDDYNAIQLSFSLETKMSARDFRRPDIYKPFLLMVTLFFLQQMSGITPVLLNAASIFKSASSSLDPNVSSVITAAIMTLGSVLAAVIVDRAGRRILLLVSVSFVSLCCFALGGYYYIKQTNPELAQEIEWLPLVCLTMFLFTFNIGYGPLPWIMMSEMIPSQVRSVTSSIITATLWLICFIMSKTFVDLLEVLYDFGVFWLFGGSCILTIFIILKFVPETKGKSLEEIQMLFQNNKQKNEYM